MLDNKTILITGSSRGIGAATARLAKKYGATVILHGKDDSEELKKLSAELEVKYVHFDVTDEAAVQKAINTLADVDVLVNNAGINPSKTFMELTHEDWRQIFDVNVLGVVNVSKAIIPRMLEKKSGHIINIASIKALSTVSGKPAYAASKAAVIRMTASMAEEFAPFIRVNAVAPGFTDTEMTRTSMSSEIEVQIKKTPLGRMATVEEVAEAVLSLLDSASPSVTGKTIFVDERYSSM